MFKKIDEILNKMTMYRAVLYCLLLLLAAALSLSFFNLFAFGPFDLIASAVFIMAACIFTNAIFAWAYNAPSNVESVYITALILALIITPANPSFDKARAEDRGVATGRRFYFAKRQK